MRHIKIATRTSQMALVQANYVRDLIRNIADSIEISLIEVSTKGDRDKSDFLYNADLTGLFTSEVQNTLLQGKADIAVHSLKDLPTAITPTLTVAAILKRQSPADALVASGPVGSISDLPAGATVGTSSLRRTAQLKHKRKDLKCVPMRGNVETRLAKVADGLVDAVVVAKAGLQRLALTDRISATLAPEDFIPAPAQGALAVQVRADNTELAELIGQLDHKPTRTAVETERGVLAVMRGGCSIPLGVYAQFVEEQLSIHAMIADIDGKTLIRQTGSCHPDQNTTCAKNIAGKLLQAGGREILTRRSYLYKNLEQK